MPTGSSLSQATANRFGSVYSRRKTLIAKRVGGIFKQLPSRKPSVLKQHNMPLQTRDLLRKFSPSLILNLKSFLILTGFGSFFFNLMRKYPIEQSDIDKAIKKLKSQQEVPVSKIAKAHRRHNKRVKRTLAKVKQLPILPLAEAIKRLGDNEVYRKASKGFRFSDDD